jgi:hypothetical protein
MFLGSSQEEPKNLTTNKSNKKDQKHMDTLIADTTRTLGNIQASLEALKSRLTLRLQNELSDLDRAIREAHNQCRVEVGDRKKEATEKVKMLESQRFRKRNELFEVQDKVSILGNYLMDKLEEVISSVKSQNQDAPSLSEDDNKPF